MTFREAMEHYRLGNASEEERAYVEQEIEKSQLISEYLDEQWEKEMENEEAPATEMKKLRKSLFRRNVTIILFSLLLSVTVIFGTIYAVIPALEKRYWNPQENTFDCAYSNDLELMLAAYNELFVAGQTIKNVTAKHTGFASYDLSIQYFDNVRFGDTNYASATLVKNELFIPDELELDTNPVNIFERGTYPYYMVDEYKKNRTYKKLQELPEYVQVYAAVSFPEDLNMEELIKFNLDMKNGQVCWIGIRNAPNDTQQMPLCGIEPWTGGIDREGINDEYPLFQMKYEGEITAEDYEQHFKSLLQYMADCQTEDRDIDIIKDNYYAEVLDYVKKNGVYTYGCYVKASPQTILKLLDKGEISYAYIVDAWINIW